MLPFKKAANITNITFDQEILFGTEIESFIEIPEVTPIPSHSIIYKTVTGIGATHSEIVSERSSIIVLPHISIIKSKHEYYKRKEINTLAIYGDVTYKDVLNHLLLDEDHAKE